MVKLFAMMGSRMRQGLLQSLFYQYMFLEFNEDLQPYVPSDFIALCSKGISILRQNEKDNIIYYLAKGGPHEKMVLVLGYQLIECHLDYSVITFAVLP